MSDFFSRLFEFLSDSLSFYAGSAGDEKNGTVSMIFGSIAFVGLLGIIVGIATDSAITAVIFGVIGVVSTGLAVYFSRRHHRGLH